MKGTEESENAMREHEVKFHSADDPATMRIGFAVRCRRCGSRVFSWLDMRSFGKVTSFGKSVEENVRQKLLKEWKQSIPADCDEALALNLCTEIYDS